MMNPPSLVEYKNLRFLITDTPNDNNILSYLHEMQKHQTTDVVRACKGSYSIEPLTAAGIEVHELAYADGDPPPADIITKWLALVKERIDGTTSPEQCISVHCVAGLGRAPQLVALALIEYGRMEALDAVTYIRKARRGAINSKQLEFLENYEPQTHPKPCCLVM